MSTQIRPIIGTDSTNHSGYHISAIQPRFTDWNGGLAVSDESEDRREDIPIDRPTMEMGNETRIGYDPIVPSPPSESYVISGKDLYERLRSHNRDTWWRYRVDVDVSKSADIEFKRHLIKAFAFELELNEIQRERAYRRFMQLDLPRSTGRIETNAFLICSIGVNNDADEYDSEKLYHPQRSSENNDDSFQRLEDALTDRFPRITKSSLTKVYNKLQQGSQPIRQQPGREQTTNEYSPLERPSYASDHYDPTSD